MQISYHSLRTESQCTNYNIGESNKTTIYKNERLTQSFIRRNQVTTIFFLIFFSRCGFEPKKIIFFSIWALLIAFMCVAVSYLSKYLELILMESFPYINCVCESKKKHANSFSSNSDLVWFLSDSNGIFLINADLLVYVVKLKAKKQCELLYYGAVHAI